MAKVGGEWVAVKVTEVNSDGWEGKAEIVLSTQTQELKINFNTVDECKGLQITVIGSFDSKDCEINEIVVDKVEGTGSDTTTDTGTGTDTTPGNTGTGKKVGLSCQNCAVAYCGSCRDKCKEGSSSLGECCACMSESSCTFCPLCKCSKSGTDTGSVTDEPVTDEPVTDGSGTETTQAPKKLDMEGGVEIKSCESSAKDSPCDSAFDGNTGGTGWTITTSQLKKGPVSGGFTLQQTSTVNQVTVYTVNLKKFKCMAQVGGKWVAVKVNEVNSDGWKTAGKDEILLSAETKELKINFEAVAQYTGFQITIIESFSSKDCVINEIVCQNVKGSGTGPGPDKGGKGPVAEQKKAKVGTRVIMFCNDFYKKYDVMWKETTSNTIITKGEELTGKSTYGNRVSVSTKDGDRAKRWNLKIQPVKLEDKGTYECHYVRVGESKSLGLGHTIELDVVEQNKIK